MIAEYWNRNSVITLIRLFLGSPVPMFALEPSRWTPEAPLDGGPRELALEIEELFRELHSRYAPARPPAFGSPVHGISYPEQVALENAAVDQANTEREAFLNSLCLLMESDAIYSTVPKEAHARLDRLKELLRRVPEEGQGDPAA